MTFIASVVARNGVALIADSLVTSMTHTLELGKFLNYLEHKQSNPDEKISIDATELLDLFVQKASHTKDYEDKLFQYDEYTAVTTAGAAAINGKRIYQLIEEIIGENKKNKRSYAAKSIDTKIDNLAERLTDEAKKHLASNTTLEATTLIVTHFDKKDSNSVIKKLEVGPASSLDLEDPDHIYVTIRGYHNWDRVVCDGQNRTSERILFGDLFNAPLLVRSIANIIVEQYQIEPLPSDYAVTVLNKLVQQDLISDTKMFKLTQLSLQQAVDLANLLMRIEIDFQKYTENIPTVGGVIKLAVIDKDGFRFISGHEIAKPIS